MKRRDEIRPIGKVASMFRDLKEIEIAYEDDMHLDIESEIVLRNDLRPALKGLKEFSHIWVIYGLERTGRVEIKTRPGPPEMRDLPKIGVFASRSQYRPNHLVLRLVELLNVKNNKLVVKGLDAINNSPVLDIKPYVPYYDLPKNPKVANWYSKWIK
ncbi:MAG: tRNA (N6-threonylcarbamoyladenosine(37)-N6)-methyltransferase TrmO [Candidatus Aenigmatarchaeota archaeon]|nr:MAG: tRNA (N6-threonylcarbamoyladenosine(37)-N6)-methyltransferase TrmO [Candidatus Aenigmarchaeota archaeon]